MFYHEFMFQDDLINWYNVHKRDLIFRKDKDPYKIWISEIMAQQTRIEAMLPYYTRFLAEIPDIETLASIDDERLQKLWQGLGYYSRCRNLKKCAQVCMKEYGGQLPCTKAELVKLPGIGPYTAGAIASIAFDERVSAVDGNVLRVFSRLFHMTQDIKTSAGRKAITAKVDESLPDTDRISAYNQAIMELGALICLPKHPHCEQCPIRKDCQAYHYQDAETLPVKSANKPRKIVKKKIYIWISGRRIHLHKRPETGLLAGLYEFDAALPDQYEDLLPLKPYTHIFSHVEWHMDAYAVFTDQWDADYKSTAEIDRDYAIPGAFQPFYQQVKEILK